MDIDTAMTELKKVTDETSSTYSQFLSNAGKCIFCNVEDHDRCPPVLPDQIDSDYTARR